MTAKTTNDPMPAEKERRSFRITKVYTKTGDEGQTGLVGGGRVSKADARIEAYGTREELNATLGMVAEVVQDSLHKQVRRIQNELFDIGGELAVLPEDRHEAQLLVEDDAVTRLEQELDAANEALPTLRSFILPGGSPLAAQLHVARTLARRAERHIAELAKMPDEPVAAAALAYTNRLSDWFFVAGRAANNNGLDDVKWVPGANR